MARFLLIYKYRVYLIVFQRFKIIGIMFNQIKKGVINEKSKGKFKDKFFKSKLFYIEMSALMCCVALMAGFQNCGNNVAEIGGPAPTNPIEETSIGVTDHIDFLRVASSLNGLMQEDFAVEDNVDLALTPADHQNLDKAESFDWYITNEEWEPNYACAAVCYYTEDDPDTCRSPCDDLPPSKSIYENQTTKVANTQFQFKHTGVYDISASLQESVTKKGVKTFESYGPRYETSVVIGKCAASDLQIINIQDPVQTSTQSQTVNSAITTNDHLSLPPDGYYDYVGQATRYASLFALELNGELLEFDSYGYYSGSNPVYGGSNIGSGVALGNTVSQQSSEDRLSPPKPSMPDYPTFVEQEERKIRWKLMAEMVDTTYGRWYHRFAQQNNSLGAWYRPWPENYTYMTFGTGITSNTTFSGNFLLEVFVQLPGEDCIHFAKKAFQIPANLIPSIALAPQPISIEIPVEDATDGNSGSSEEASL